MPALIPLLTTALGKSLLSLLMALLTEKFLKKGIIAVLEEIADKTKSDLDNKLLAAAKEAWEEKPDAP